MARSDWKALVVLVTFVAGIALIVVGAKMWPANAPDFGGVQSNTPEEVRAGILLTAGALLVAGSVLALVRAVFGGGAAPGAKK